MSDVELTKYRRELKKIGVSPKLSIKVARRERLEKTLIIIKKIV